MNIYKNILISCVLFYAPWTFAKTQEDVPLIDKKNRALDKNSQEEKSDLKKDSNPFVKSFDGAIGIKTFHRQNINDFVITMGDKAGSEGTLVYEPLVVPQTGGAVSWRHGSLQLSTQSNKGSRSKHYQFHYYRKNFGAEIKFRSYQSFGLKSNEQSNPIWNQRDDLMIESTHLAFYYLASEDFVSFKAGFDQTEQQLQSGWSPLFQLTGEKLVVRADEALIPPSSRSRFFLDRGFAGGDFRTFSLLAGGAFTYVPREAFFFTAAGGLGLGYQWRDYKWGDVNVQEWGLSTKHNFRVGCGYNDDRYYAGILMFTDGDTYKLENSWIENEGGFLTFYLGFRFFPDEVDFSSVSI